MQWYVRQTRGNGEEHKGQQHRAEEVGTPDGTGRRRTGMKISGGSQ